MTCDVCVVLGTRPEAIKLAPVIMALRDRPHLRTHVLLTGQHREMVGQVMELFHLRADDNLDIMVPRQTLTQITCRSLGGLEAQFENLQPKLVVVQGDTTTAFAASLAAFYHRVAIAHVEAGLRTHDRYDPYPEEINRRLISQLATLHFAPTEQAVSHLRAAGITSGIYQTGNTVVDALLWVARSPQLPVPELAQSSYRLILGTVHRRENWGEPLRAIAWAWRDLLAEFPDVALLLPLHLNPAVREPLEELLAGQERVYLTEPLDYAQLVGALKHCYLVMTDSGGLQEEAPSLGKPVLVLRRTTERPEAVAAGTAELVGTDRPQIVQAARRLLTDPTEYTRRASIQNPFGDGHATERIMAAVEEFLVSIP
ncbi:MAG: UDP-N-acetylglucosamine 2-epimerase (non-hydrolyzing) [Oscillatoriales cyanobacterium SM2_2_1]|nr:UDP-N-acetylglucosamine 2-epimerase (non-hydrolyzing) [Oscillatoriales cyanobacterium SM2_2_1]